MLLNVSISSAASAPAAPAEIAANCTRLHQIAPIKGPHLNLPRRGHEKLPTQENVDSSARSEEHTSELQSRGHLVCRLLLEKKKKKSKHRQRPSRNVHAPSQRGRTGQPDKS